jgi:hypothetical protein
MKRWWQGWSVGTSYLFGMVIVLLTMAASALAKRIHSNAIEILVSIIGILLIIWVGRILIWNIQHRTDPSKSE